MGEKKSNHQANIVRLGAPRVHAGADTLELFDIGGYQVVVKKGQFKEGDLAVYIQPDSVVPQNAPFMFLWGNFIGTDGSVPEHRRRVTVRRFRKEWSEGLLMPATDFWCTHDTQGGSTQMINGDIWVRCQRCGKTWSPPDGNGQFIVPGWESFKEGDDVSDLLGITHYDPDAGRESTSAKTEHAPRRRYPKTLRGWFWFVLDKLGLTGRSVKKNLALEVDFNFPIYDVEAYKNFKNALQPGDSVHITEKIHGSNARFVFVEGKMYAGSHRQWKQAGDSIWWKAIKQHPEIEQWCIVNEGHVLYGEVVPTQGKNFNYGYKDGEVGFFAFDVLQTDGTWVWPGNAGFAPTVPIVGVGPFSESMLKLADGTTLVPGAKHIREGIVIRALNRERVRGLSRVHLKIVSNVFLEKDSK